MQSKARRPLTHHHLFPLSVACRYAQTCSQKQTPSRGSAFSRDTVPAFFKDSAPLAPFHSCLVCLFSETDVLYSSVELLSQRKSLCFCTEMRQSLSLNKPSGSFLAVANIHRWHNYIQIVWLIILQERKSSDLLCFTYSSFLPVENYCNRPQSLVSNKKVKSNTEIHVAELWKHVFINVTMCMWPQENYI